jgi:hypothetical protein
VSKTSEESIAPLCREQLGETAAELNDVRRAHDGKVHTVVPIDTRRGVGSSKSYHAT